MIKMQLIGYLGRDAVKREVNGVSVLNFSVAVTERFKNALGVLQERTTWADCSLWERDYLAPFLKLGTQVFIEGSPRVEGYVSNNTGEVSGALRIRVGQLQLLSRKDDDKRRATTSIEPPVPEASPEQELPADDLPF
ncbi:single-stranded DNA-binding protein [Chitinophaga vietnamensis]|uniref:single-stranded DNA-binding protein n=1 Tax=Chitinophaga vietnamensis TaxID=2593957 RepID=UPI00117745DC|nr:single-stranded DNA-binding protein [Chitinophaga vietnamensis]